MMILILISTAPMATLRLSRLSGESLPPMAVGGNITVAEPGEIIFFSSLGSYDPDGEIVFYEWDFQEDGIFEWNSTENNHTSGNTEYSYKDEGAYNATLRVTDDNGATATDVFYVLVLEEEDDDTNYDRIRAVLTVVGIIEIIGGIGMISFAIYLKRKLYDTL